MQRLSIIVLCIAMVTLGTIASQAQGSSIASVIEQRSNSGLEFTTLQRFIDASDLENNLSSAGSYTLFAPTDAAFERLERAINYTTEQLLSNQEIINAMVRYHTVESRLSASQLRARDGRVIATELPNAFVGITRADDNTIVVNNVVEITDENISASNGIIHEINDVLLNRVINDLLDEAFGTPATATPTPSPTSTPPATTTPTSQTRSTANVRVLHLAMDAPEMTIQLDSMTVIETLAYQDFSDFSNISQGIYTARAISLDDDQDITLTVDLTLLNGDFVTLVLIGSLDADTLDFITFTDDLRAVDDDEATVTLFNALPDAPPISLVLDGDPLFEGVSYTEREVDIIDAETTMIQLLDTRDDDTVYLDRDEQSFDAEGLYWFVLFGAVDDPRVRILSSTSDDITNLLSTTMEITETPAIDATAPSLADSIIDILDASDDYTVLIQALNAADSDIVDILGNPDSDPVTFLAPTDQAFENLLATTGLRQTQLLRDPSLLDNILRYHIIEGELTADDFIDASGTSIETFLEPAQAFFVRATDDGRIFLNGTIEFLETDIRASNGIIHTVDDVLLPLIVLEDLDL